MIYWFRCSRLVYDKKYIGESARTFGERLKEYLKVPSPIYEHQSITGHSTSVEDFSILGSEDNHFTRSIKESIYIKINNPTLNKHFGKYILPHIWDRFLLTTHKVKIKYQQEQQESEAYNTTQVPSTPRSIVEENMLHSGIGFHSPQVHWGATSHLHWAWSAGLHLGIASRSEQTTQIEATSITLTFYWQINSIHHGSIHECSIHEYSIHRFDTSDTPKN